MDFLFSIGKCRLYILWEKKEVSENQDEMLVQTASRSVCACVSCYNATVNFLSSTSSLCWQALEERGWWLWGHGPGRLLSLRHKHSSESSWAECCKWHFFLRCLLQKKKKNHHFSSYFETESIDGVCTPFFLHLSWGKEVMEEMEKRGCSWDYEKFGFTRCNCLNCSLANFMDKI